MRNVHCNLRPSLHLASRLMRVAAVAVLCLSIPAILEAQGRGVLEGKLVNRTDPSIPARAAEVDVVALDRSMNVIQSSVTDASGKFRVDGLPTEIPLMVRATYKSVSYRGHVNFDTAGKATVAIEVYEPTASMRGIKLEGVRMAFQLSGDGLRSLETYSFKNETRPPRSFTSPDGSLRFSKAPGILEPPRVSVLGPGSTMPLVQSPLESADGQSYYSLYPLRPGTTSFDVEQSLPYVGGSYTYTKKLYYGVGSIEISVIPQDMIVSGVGLAKVRTEPRSNFSVYSMGPVEAGTEVVWTFSGGTPVVEASGMTEPGPEAEVRSVPTSVARNALVIGPLLLMGFIAVLWHGFRLLARRSAEGRDRRLEELRERRELLLNSLAGLDKRYESRALDQSEYLQKREQGKRELRRIAVLLGKKRSGS